MRDTLKLLKPVSFAVLLALNVPLFLFGLKKQGIVFTIYSLYAVAVYSVSSYIITYVLPVDVSRSPPIAGTDLLLRVYHDFRGVGGYGEPHRLQNT